MVASRIELIVVKFWSYWSTQIRIIIIDHRVYIVRIHPSINKRNSKKHVAVG